MKEFCLETYIPLIRNVTAHIELPMEKKTDLFKKLVGILIKFVSALIYQVKKNT